MIDVEVEDAAWAAALADVEDVARRSAEAALAGAGRAAPLPAGASLAILLTDDAALRALNHDFRDKDAATNVLSFPAAMSARPHLGDLALAYGVCAREAQAQAKPLAHHLAHLTVHGVLHLLGYDHEAEAEAEVMEQTERRVLEGLGLPDPYAQDHHG